MTQEFFKAQIIRLKTRFGEIAFDTEFSKLVWKVAEGMSEKAFRQAVDVFIGSRPAHSAPLLTDFREASLTERNNNLKRDTQVACKVLNHPVMIEPISNILSRSFGEAKTVGEAIRIAKRTLREVEREI